MNTLTRVLLQVLQKEKDSYAVMVELSLRKRAAILNNDSAVLDEVVEAERELLVKIDELELKREQNAAAWAQELGCTREEITVSFLADRMQGMEKNLTLTAQKELRDILSEQMKQNEINGELLRSKLEYLNAIIKTLTQDVQISNTYGKDGGTVDLQGGKSIGVDAEI